MAEKTPTKPTSSETCVCRTCDRNIISKNHPLALFGEKAIKEGIGRDLEIFCGVKFLWTLVFHLEYAELVT